MSGPSSGSRLGQTRDVSSNRRCYRHATGRWMAYCPDCTAWYLTAQITRRNERTTTSNVA